MSMVSNALTTATAAVAEATVHTQIWHTRAESKGAAYVATVHAGIKAIDIALKALHDARQALVDELAGPEVHFPSFMRWSCGDTLGKEQSEHPEQVTCRVCLAEGAAAELLRRRAGESS